MSVQLEQVFENLRPGAYAVTSPRTLNYNCIAWAAEEVHRRWWPTVPGWYWPTNVPREETMVAFIAAFRQLGYEECQDSALEPGYQKVALYVSAAGSPTHMARQLDTGGWTSKLGTLEDIRHETLAGVEGASYGRAVSYLKRPRNATLTKSRP